MIVLVRIDSIRPVDLSALINRGLSKSESSVLFVMFNIQDGCNKLIVEFNLRESIFIAIIVSRTI